MPETSKKEIQIICKEQKPVWPDKIRLKLEVCVVERGEEGRNRRVENILMEVRVGVGKVFKQQTDSNGMLILGNVEVPYQDEQGITIEVVAHDDLKEIKEKINISIEEGLQKLREMGMNMQQTRKELERAAETISSTLEVYHHENRPNEPVFKNNSKDSKSVRAAVQKIVDNESFPFMEEILSRIHQEPILVYYIEIFKKSSFGEKLVENLAKWQPQLVIKNFSRFYDMPWTKKIVLSIAKEEPQIALNNVKKYEYQPWFKDVLLEIARQIPEKVLLMPDVYKNSGWRSELIKPALLQSNEDTILRFERAYFKEPWMEEMVNDAKWKMEVRKHAMLVCTRNERNLDVGGLCKLYQFPDEYFQQDWTEPTLTKIIENYYGWAEGIIRIRNKYRGQPWESKILELATKQVPKDRIPNIISNISDQPWGEGVILEALEHGEKKVKERIAECIIESTESYVSLPNLQKVFLLAAKVIGVEKLFYYDHFRGRQEPWRKKVLIWALGFDPNMVLYHAGSWDSYEWASQVVHDFLVRADKQTIVRNLANLRHWEKEPWFKKLAEKT